MNELTLRPAEPEDFDFLYDLHCAALKPCVEGRSRAQVVRAARFLYGRRNLYTLHNENLPPETVTGCRDLFCKYSEKQKNSPRRHGEHGECSHYLRCLRASVVKNLIPF